MKYRGTVFLIAFAMVGAQFVCVLTKAQSATSVRTYRVGSVGNLELTAPTDWLDLSKTLEKPPAVTLTFRLASTKDFYMKVTTAWEPQQERSSRDAGWLRGAVERSGQKLLSQASETKLELIEINSANAKGYYFQLTSKGNVPEGEFRYITQGIVDLGKTTLVFTTFSAKKDLPQVAESLRVVGSARFIQTPFQTEETAEQAAQKVAESWLPLIDSQKYEESWEVLSPKTKDQYSERQWEAGMMGFRKPLGELKSRTFGKVVYSKSLQGYPEHEGAIVRFDSVYQNKESVIELVLVIHDKDGKWRVLLYTIPE